MARISLLFSLAFALALGSLFLSVSSHAPPAGPRPMVWSKTVSELQTLPFTKITELLNRKEKFAPKTAEFKAMFTMCKGYVAYLESLYKLENPIVDVLGIAKAKYTLMNKAIVAAQASIIRKVDKKTSKRLKRICAGLTKGFLRIQETIIKISAKHDFKADGKLSFRESAEIYDAVIDFREWINAFMDVVYDVEEKKVKKVGHHARKLEEDRVKNAFARFFRNFANRYGGYLGGKTPGRQLTEADADVKLDGNSHAGADIKGFETIYEKISHFFGGYLGSLNPHHGRELVEAHAGGKVKGSLGDFLNKNGVGFGGKVQFNAAGKMKFAGKDGFRSLNRSHKKHLVSTKA